jgi:hypothetical protein
MSASILFAAYFQLLVEPTRDWRNDIAAQNTKPLPCFYQFFVGKRSDKFAVIVFAEFAEPDWAKTSRHPRLESQRKGEDDSNMVKLLPCPQTTTKIRRKPSTTTGE